MAKQLLKQKEKLTNDQILKLMDVVHYPKNSTRLNVMSDGVSSIKACALGMVQQRVKNI